MFHFHFLIRSDILLLKTPVDTFLTVFDSDNNIACGFIKKKTPNEKESNRKRKIFVLFFHVYMKKESMRAYLIYFINENCAKKSRMICQFGDSFDRLFILRYMSYLVQVGRAFMLRW